MRRIGWLLFILLIIYFIFLIRQNIIDNLELKAEEKRVFRNIEKAEKLAQELEVKAKKLMSDAYLEELARVRLGLIKKGETAYKVIE